MEKIKNLWFDGNRLYMRSSEGRVFSRPLEAYPEAVRWEALDADMHISSFYETTEPNESNEVAAMFNRFPWLNVSEVARYLDINKSLLARYIYGISKPSEQRLAQIREALHMFGRELQSA